VLIMQQQSGLFTGSLLEGNHPWAVGNTADQVLLQLKEYLAWDRKQGARPDPDLASLKVADIKLQLQPEYKPKTPEGSPRISYPCLEQVPFRIPCVFGRKSSGMFVGIMPSLGVRFQTYETSVLHGLARHYVRQALTGQNPLQLTRCLTPRSRRVEEILLTEKGLLRPRQTTPWHENVELSSLAAVADPLGSRSESRSYAKAFLRDGLVEELYQRLQTKRTCVMLVGKPGVGKTTVAAEVARRMEREARQEKAETPQRIWITNAHRIIAGMPYLGEWEKRCEEMIEQILHIDGILCVENLVDLTQLGGFGTQDSVAAFLAPYIKRGELRLIAETTPREREVCRRLLPGFPDLLQVLEVPVFTSSEATQVLRETTGVMAQNLHVSLESGIAETVTGLHSRFLPYAAFPGQAVRFVMNLLDSRTTRDTKRLAREDLVQAFVRQTGLPELFLRDELTLQEGEVFQHFRRHVIGQDRACRAAAGLVTRFKAGMNDPTRPIGVLMFCGPTGVGKTALARRLSRYFFGGGGEFDRLIRLDMSEYGAPDGAARLVTGPDGGPSDLIRRLRRQPFSLVLFDEVEKAHPQVFDVLMNVFDEGRLSDPLGRVTVFRSAILLMTSNLGASRQGSPGFVEQRPNYEEEVMRFFRPEFFNRIDAIVAFDPLQKDVIRSIAEKELGEIADREGLVAAGITLKWAPAVVDHVAAAGFDARYGARPLQRTVESAVVTPLARLLAERPGLKNTELRLDMGKEGRIAVKASA